MTDEPKMDLDALKARMKAMETHIRTKEYRSLPLAERQRWFAEQMAMILKEHGRLPKHLEKFLPNSH